MGRGPKNLNKVLIVDDETIVRVMLKSLVDWEKYGFEIEGDFVDGQQAFQYLKTHTADLMLMDMKMPEMDGLELLERLNREGNFPVTIVLSGYNEFELVREAFRLGAYDYILKSDLTREKLGDLLNRLNGSIFQNLKEKKTLKSNTEHFSLDFDSLKPGNYGSVLFEIDNFRKQAARFSGEEEELMKSVLELARQISRVAARAKIQPVSLSRYVMFYRAENEANYQSSVLSAVKQLQSVWRDYINLEVSAAVSLLVPKERLREALDQDEALLKLSVLAGGRAVCTEWENRDLLWSLKTAGKKYGKLISALYANSGQAFEKEKKALFSHLEEMKFEDAARETAAVIALLAEKFEECGEDFFTLFPDKVDYIEKIAKLGGIKELTIWLNNYFNWVLDYLGNGRDDSQANTILKARRFMMENYANPELTLKSVADYVGLNEKYFTTRFTKEAGVTFSNYLTSLRLEKAKELLCAGRRIYEISEKVGYNNVEHFNRTFKKAIGVSPGDYKKQNGKI